MVGGAEGLAGWLSQGEPDDTNQQPDAVAGRRSPGYLQRLAENNLKLKVSRFVCRPDAPKNLKEALLNHLILEQG